MLVDLLVENNFPLSAKENLVACGNVFGHTAISYIEVQEIGDDDESAEVSFESSG